MEKFDPKFLRTIIYRFVAKINSKNAAQSGAPISATLEISQLERNYQKRIFSNITHPFSIHEFYRYENPVNY